jgi:CO dehydrogenase nickel-insertion accessory protein CooC1
MVGLVITIAQRKGGAGKTTLATQFAVTWARRGARVAALDIDNALRGHHGIPLPAKRRPAMGGPCAMERRFAYNEPAYYGPVYRGPGYYPPHTSQHGTVQ